LFAGRGGKITPPEKYFSNCLLRIRKSGSKVRTLRDAREGYRGGKNVFNPIHIAIMGTTAQTRRDAAAYGRLCVDEGDDTID